MTFRRVLALHCYIRTGWESYCEITWLFHDLKNTSSVLVWLRAVEKEPFFRAQNLSLNADVNFLLERKRDSWIGWILESAVRCWVRGGEKEETLRFKPL